MKNETNVNKQSLTFRLLYYWGKFLGLNPLSLSEDNELEISYPSTFYGCFLGTMFCYVLYQVLMERLKLHVPGETPAAVIVDFIGIGCQFLETFLTWLIFALSQNSIKCFVKDFAKIEKISANLGIPDSREKFLRECGISVLLNNVLYLASLAFSTNYMASFSTYRSIVWISLNLPRVSSFNMLILFVWSLRVVKLKFRRINEIVRILPQNDYLKSRVKTTHLSSGLITISSRDDVLISHRIIMVSQLHRQLRDLVCRIERHFASPVLFSFGNHLACLALSFYTIYRYWKGLKRIVATDLIILAASSHWIFYPVASLLVVSNVCGSTSDEVALYNIANNTGNILHGMLNNCKDFGRTRESAELNLLSLDLLQNRVSISLYGLFVLNEFFIYNTLSAVIMYITIMLQFYG